MKVPAPLSSTPQDPLSEPTCLVADTICRTVELGLTITGAAIAEDLIHIECRPVDVDPRCPTCEQPRRLRDHVERVLTDLPVVTALIEIGSGALSVKALSFFMIRGG